ncbi:MAG: IPT/TIG domain-containing protein, partial [Pseudomonadota bacterium]|nr:IPT/TIG domain-containing protein [Pseudomonadota bacterium]
MASGRKRRSASAPLVARYVDESQLECSSAVRASGVAGVLLSMNGQQYAPSGVSYTYQSSASVSYLSPATVLSDGGTPVTVHGSGFSSASEALGSLTCRIGSVVRRAVWASSSALVCNSTRAAAGEA